MSNRFDFVFAGELMSAHTPVLAALRPNATSTPFLGEAAFDLGWDLACHGVPLPMQAMPGIARLEEGWKAARDDARGHKGRATAFDRSWLTFRLRELSRGRVAQSSLTPGYLQAIAPRHCPILRTPLDYSMPGGAGPTVERAWTVVRLDPAMPCQPGNGIIVSEATAKTVEGLQLGSLSSALRAADRMAADREEGLTAAQRARVGFLFALAAPPQEWIAQARPMVLLPPAGFEYANPLVALQEQLTLEFWLDGKYKHLARTELALPSAARMAMRSVYEALEDAIARSARSSSLNARWLSEDAWTDSVVRSRWTRLVLILQPAEVQQLAGRLDRGADSEFLARGCWIDIAPPGRRPLESLTSTEIVRR
jgi:hypothetical protein